MISPQKIQFEQIGEEELGFISVMQHEAMPFEVKRIYWIYDTPEEIIRGNHALIRSEQVLIAAKGEAKIILEDKDGKQTTYLLNDPNEGLHIPPGYWKVLKLSEGTVLLSVSSAEYDESEYIRDHDQFLQQS